MAESLETRDAIKLEIITPEGRQYLEEVSAVTLPSSLGSLGILLNHAPLMCTLEWGILEYTQKGASFKVVISEGLADISDNRVIVLVRIAEKPEDIDFERAKQALERSKERLASGKPDIDTQRAKAALHRAMFRMKVQKN